MMEEQQFMVWFGVRNGMLWHCGPEIIVDVDDDFSFHGRIIYWEIYQVSFTFGDVIRVASMHFLLYNFFASGWVLGSIMK